MRLNQRPQRLEQLKKTKVFSKAGNSTAPAQILNLTSEMRAVDSIPFKALSLSNEGPSRFKHAADRYQTEAYHQYNPFLEDTGIQQNPGTQHIKQINDYKQNVLDSKAHKQKFK